MIQLRFHPSSALLVLNVQIEFQVKHFFKMALDTGASITLISSHAASVIGYDISTLPVTNLYTASQKEQVHLVRLKSLSLGEEKIPDLEARVMTIPQELNIDGLLGLNFLRHFNINLDFERGSLLLRKFTP